MLGILRKLESMLQSAFEGSPALGGGDFAPLDLVRQIEREIERNKRVFINDQTYIAHKLVIHLYAPTRSCIEEYEALFNNPTFRKYIEDYVAEREYQLLDHIRIVIQCHQELLPEFGKRRCFVEFSWPQASSDPGEVTVVLDPHNSGRLLSVNAPVSALPVPAWLEVLEGKTYHSRVPINRRDFYIGRTENVLHPRTQQVIRINHLAFERPAAEDAINRSVSREHALVSYRDGSFRLSDTGSQNHTTVERGSSTILVPETGPTTEPVALEDGDVICFGSARARFHLGVMPVES